MFHLQFHKCQLAGCRGGNALVKIEKKELEKRLITFLSSPLSVLSIWPSRHLDSYSKKNLPLPKDITTTYKREMTCPFKSKKSTWEDNMKKLYDLKNLLFRNAIYRLQQTTKVNLTVFWSQIKEVPKFFLDCLVALKKGKTE